MIRTSAKSLAEKAGAAQYAVHIEEELSPDEISNPHDLRKRLSDENLFDDSDYEIYQGVVGRPGIDFPVLTGIPQTTFNCRDVGNGYFADLETECQVIIYAFLTFFFSSLSFKPSIILLTILHVSFSFAEKKFRCSIFARVARKSHSFVQMAQFFNKPN